MATAATSTAEDAILALLSEFGPQFVDELTRLGWRPAISIRFNAWMSADLLNELSALLERNRKQLDWDRECLRRMGVEADRVIVDQRFALVAADVHYDGLAISTEVAGMIVNPIMAAPAHS